MVGFVELARRVLTAVRLPALIADLSKEFAALIPACEVQGRSSFERERLRQSTEACATMCKANGGPNYRKVEVTKKGDSAEKEEAKAPPSRAKLYVRGTVSNTLGLAVLFGVSCIHEDFLIYCAVALLMQWAVFALHALPFTSEKFYDLSGSATHLAVVAVSLCLKTGVRSPRQLLISIASVVWMTRLGTFLYCRILRDGRDPRFDALKTVWLAFLGAWTVQACWVSLVQLPVLLLVAGVARAESAASTRCLTSKAAGGPRVHGSLGYPPRTALCPTGAPHQQS